MFRPVLPVLEHYNGQTSCEINISQSRKIAIKTTHSSHFKYLSNTRPFYRQYLYKREISYIKPPAGPRPWASPDCCWHCRPVAWKSVQSFPRRREWYRPVSYYPRANSCYSGWGVCIINESPIEAIITSIGFSRAVIRSTSGSNPRCVSMDWWPFGSGCSSNVCSTTSVRRNESFFHSS